MMRRRQNEIPWPNEVGKALLAGFLGTAAMTIAMMAMHRFLPREQQQPLPPRQITMAAAERVGIKKHMDQDTRFGATMALHFGYGTCVGALYAPFAKLMPGPYPLKGMVFGILVWAGSYLGWLPMTGLLSSATRHPAPRNALMIAAHLVWGTVIAVIVDGVHRRNRNQSNSSEAIVRLVPIEGAEKRTT